jgi:hypothetical protein
MVAAKLRESFVIDIVTKSKSCLPVRVISGGYQWRNISDSAAVNKK